MSTCKVLNQLETTCGIYNIESSDSESESERVCAMTSDLETEQARVIKSSIPESDSNTSTTTLHRVVRYIQGRRITSLKFKNLKNRMMGEFLSIISHGLDTLYRARDIHVVPAGCITIFT